MVEKELMVWCCWWGFGSRGRGGEVIPIVLPFVSVSGADGLLLARIFENEVLKSRMDAKKKKR